MTYVCYEVSGATPDEIRASMDASPSRPRDIHDNTFEDALTLWNYHVDWTDAMSGGACRATSVTPTVAVSFTFPRWVAPPDPLPATVSRWDAYVAALETHEKGHEQNGIDAASDAITRIRAVSVSDCAGFDAAAQAAIAAATADGNAADQRYDATTDHGATQGARFP
ncbi:MAG: DUF922 domain-containing protein [Chloroflexi bacterium]|nr:DUF922 domain-containing protein [Chloroflexota bacterium]